MQRWTQAMCLLTLAGLPEFAAAQSTDAQRDAEIARLRQTVDQLLLRIEALEAQRPGQVAGTEPGPPVVTPRPPASAITAPAASTANAAPPAEPAAQEAALAQAVPPSSVPAHERFDEDEQAGARIDNEAPPGDPLEGFFRVPGTATWLRLGGYAKLDAMVDDDDAGDTDQFITSEIPVGDQRGKSRFNMHARQSRFTLEGRSETEHGPLRFLLQNDFFGSGGSYGYRLRHAWAQLGNTYAGFGWSAFMDLDAGPDTLDFAGPGVVPAARLASIRQYFPLGSGNQIVLAAEHRPPELQVSGEDARTRNVAPSLVVAGRHEADWGHLQLGALLRYLAYDAEDRSDGTLAGGAALTGSWGAARGDYLIYGAVVGRGIAAYLGDLGGLDLDAVVDDQGRVRALEEWGGWIGYTHLWNARWRSTLTFGRLYLERDPLLAAGAFRRSDYAAANLVWEPAPSWSWGLELLYGQLEGQDGAEGDAMRLQTSLKYDFIQ